MSLVRGQIRVSTKDQFLTGREVQPHGSVSLSYGRHAAEGIQTLAGEEGREAAP